MILGVLGLSHLGLVSAIAFSKKKVKTIAIDKNLPKIIKNNKIISISEPKLDENIKDNKFLTFSNNFEDISKCDLLYIAEDIPTDRRGNSDNRSILKIINIALKFIKKDSTLIIHSQVRPGFTRSIFEKKHKKIFYQVETLIFGQAFYRAYNPERIIIGKDALEKKIDTKFRNFLKKFNCPIIEMTFESAELTKISINMYLISSITFANYMSGLAKKINADWNSIVEALKLDKRIGSHAYIYPNVGISGGNLERDLKSTEKLSLSKGYSQSLPIFYRKLSNNQKDWVYNILKKNKINGKIGILGLSYKENTNSIKNSPSCYLIDKLKNKDLVFFDPKVKRYNQLNSLSNPEELIKRTNVIIFMTNWNVFKKINYKMINKYFKGKYIIDPYKIIDGKKIKRNINYFCL